MAFFGVSISVLNGSTPSTSQTAESCDMTPYQAVLVSREVRMRGITAAQQTYANLHYEYTQAYAAYQQLQADVTERSQAVGAFLQAQEPAARAVCERAALAKIEQINEKGTDYTHPKYASLVSGLSEDHRRAVDELLIPYYTYVDELEMAENALWVKHSSLTAAEQVRLLWTVELNAADWQLQTLPAGEGKSADRNIAELRHLAQRVAEIRKKRLLRRKEKTVTRHLALEKPGVDNASSTQSEQQALAVPDDASRVSSAPLSARSSTTRSTTSKARKSKKKLDFDAGDWL